MAVELPLVEELGAVFARASGLLLSREVVRTALSLITSLAEEAFPGTGGAGITLLDEHGARVTAAATDAVVERADRLQYQLGQGPCLAAWERPLTAGVDTFVVTGVVEPRDTVCGDVFDYALSESTASLMILDGVGHDPRSGLVAAAALAAYRSARHQGSGLFERARLIDECLGAYFDAPVFVTAVLAEIDLGTGRLRAPRSTRPAPAAALAAGAVAAVALAAGALAVRRLARRR
jgi:Stage II sporulation protein E (SpoIIE)